MWKLRTVPASFFTQRLHRNDEKNPKIWCARWKKVERGGSAKGNKVLHAWLSWRRRERGVSGRPVMLKEDKVPEEPVTPPWSRLHILSPAGALAWLCPTKASVTHRVYGMLLHAFAYMCNCVWKFSLSHSVSVAVSSHALSVTTVFLLVLCEIRQQQVK